MRQQFDVLIRNATVIDGTGDRRYQGDIGLRGDRIARIGDLASSSAKEEIDLGGRVAAPGFIDAHSHDDRLMLSAPLMQPKVSQGITTVVTGNCGISLAPMPARPAQPATTPPLNLLDEEGGWFRFPTFAAYLDALRAESAATNCAPLVGHTALRVASMENLQRPASESERLSMRAALREGLEAGAIGMSAGLFYAPARQAPAEEVIAVGEPLKEFGGVFCIHMRDEADHVMDSLEESFGIGRALGVPVIISHHKVTGAANYGRSQQTLAFIRQSMALQPICLDCYPYPAGSTVLNAPTAKGCSRVIVSWSRSLPQYAGRDLADVAREMGVSEEAAIDRLSPAGAIYFKMDEADVQRILSFEHTMVGTDGLPHDAAPHPRLWGAFPRVLGRYTRTLGLFSLEKAVHKMTGLTAGKFGLRDRGVLTEGAYADLTLFDAEIVDEAATYENPIAPARGIHSVYVNGNLVWRDGGPTGLRPGRVLRREA